MFIWLLVFFSPPCSFLSTVFSSTHLPPEAVSSRSLCGSQSEFSENSPEDLDPVKKSPPPFVRRTAAGPPQKGVIINTVLRPPPVTYRSTKFPVVIEACSQAQ